MIQKLETMARSPAMCPTSKHKAISALLSYAISLEQSGSEEMIKSIFCVVRARAFNPWVFMRHHIGPNVFPLLNQPNPPSMNRATALLSPYLPVDYWDQDMVARWTVAVSAVPYSEEVGQSVVDTLLQLASRSSLQPHIPIHIWIWLEKQPSLLPPWKGPDWGRSGGDLVCYVRGLRDIKILTSYLLLVWSEWAVLDGAGFAEMQTLIMEDLGGIGMQYHREDLIKRLDHILGEVDRGLDHLGQYDQWTGEPGVQKRKEQYGTLKEVLVELDNKTIKNLAGMSQINLFQQTLIHLDVYRIPFNLHMCSASSVSMISHCFLELYHSSHSFQLLPCHDCVGFTVQVKGLDSVFFCFSLQKPIHITSALSCIINSQCL